jgi:hypothetical protein
MRFRLIALLTFALAAPNFAPAAPSVADDGKAHDDSGPCVDVQIGSDRAPSLACINRLFQNQADREHAQGQAVAPIDSRSPSNIVGTANYAAAEEKMGNAFGKSATPQRPQLFYVNPMLAPGAH